MADNDTEDTPRRYAAYDTTLHRYVGGVHDTKKAANDAAKAAGAKTHEVRDV